MAFGCAVDENDCVYEAQQGPACYGCRQDLRCFEQWYILSLYSSIQYPFISAVELFKHAEPNAETTSPRKLIIVVSSDKGLCGGIHSSVSKGTRRLLSTGTVAADPKPGEEKANESTVPPANDSPVVVIGDKSKSQLSRAIPQNFVLTMNQIGKDIPTFADAAAVADLVVKSGIKYDSVVIVYNKYVSAIAFEAGTMEVLNEKGLRESRK